MLAVELEQLEDNPSEVQSRVQELRKQTAELSNDVQALSHDLHSSKLEYLGVVAGMKSWCKEFAEHQEMEIDFKADVLIFCHSKSDFPCSEFYRKPCTTRSSTAGSNVSKCNWSEHSNAWFISPCRIQELGSTLKQQSKVRGLGLTSMQRTYSAGEWNDCHRIRTQRGDNHSCSCPFQFRPRFSKGSQLIDHIQHRNEHAFPPINERPHVPHRFFRQCLSPARGQTFLVHNRTKHQCRPFWLTRERVVPIESPHPLYLVPTR